MFAPPPVQLSRAEVEARLTAKRRVAANAGALSNSLHRNDSTSPRENRVFTKGRSKASVPQRTIASSPIEPPKQDSGIFKFNAGEVIESASLPSGFGEHPRRAPTPPNQSTRPPSQWFQPRPPKPVLQPQSSYPQTSDQDDTPPPIPAKSPKRLGQVADEDRTSSRDSFKEIHLGTALTNLQIREGTFQMPDDSPYYPQRSFMAPVISVPEDIVLRATSNQARTADGRAPRPGVMNPKSNPVAAPSMTGKLSGVKGAKVDKPNSRRVSAASTISAALIDFDDLKFFASVEAPPRRATDGELKIPASSSKRESQLPWKRRGRGETMSMLLEKGFFPGETFIFDKDNQKVNIRVKPPPPLSILDKELPDTPTSIMATPTEMYQNLPPRPSTLAVRPKKVASKRRGPLTPISTTNAKANSRAPAKDDENMSPGRLSAIPENETIPQKSPTTSGMTTPVATQIHLRGGSVVTVSPPELTAWNRSIYVQGPIKLPKPAIVPRKNSVASLEAFQEAIEQVYQEALNIPRRRSDDAVDEDVCEFFDDFGFDEISFEGDMFTREKTSRTEISDLFEDAIPEVERFSTPPTEQAPSPVEKVGAKEVVETLAKPNPVPKPVIPPIENEETLRAKGIARMAHGITAHASGTMHGRKDSLTLSKPQAVNLPLLPVPEESMLEVVLGPTLNGGGDIQMVNSAFDWDDRDVEELDSGSAWLAPTAFHRLHRGVTRRDSSQFRRLVANAESTIW